MTAKVGVLLDEVPASMRDRAADIILAKPKEFWLARAKKQIEYARYRLVFRQGFFPEKMQLPLPPDEAWNITTDETGAVREKVNGHDTIVMGYRYKSTLLTDTESPALSEPALAEVGGVWDEPFVLPADPEMLLQRTGYACMDEIDFPPRSVDSENDHRFFDFDCDVETPDNFLCHTAQTLATQSCRDALDSKVGRIDLNIHFERLPWDAALADTVRVGEVVVGGSDLRPRGAALADAHITYRYVPQDDCAIEEKCVGAPGFRRLLQFDASAQNLGDIAMHIGDVDYYIEGGPNDNADHHLYDFSTCHNHYHFAHYGNYSLDVNAQKDGGKKAFCLLSTARFSNNESTPLGAPYWGCSYQGIQAGWGDEYFAGLDCQWMDITDLDTSDGPTTATLGFEINPDGFLCEGKPVTDADGNPTWEATNFKTDKGETIDRPVCERVPDWEANNERSHKLILPPVGGMVVEPCTRGQIGPLRNCDFETLEGTSACVPGTTVKLSCSAAQADVAEVVRICESSIALGAVPCTLADSLANEVIMGADVEVSFKCPAARDPLEVGGTYGLYGTPVLPEDGGTQVTCVPML